MERRKKSRKVFSQQRADGNGQHHFVEGAEGHRIQQQLDQAGLRTGPSYRPEKRVFDNWDSLDVLSAYGHVRRLTQVPRGNQYYERIGNQIRVTNLNIRFMPYLTGWVADEVGGLPPSKFGNLLRVAVVIDRQPQSPILPTASEIFHTGHPQANTNYRSNALSFRFMNDVDRFQVLHDEIIPMEFQQIEVLTADVANGTLTTAAIPRLYHVNISLKTNITVRFADGGERHAVQNNILLVVSAAHGWDPTMPPPPVHRAEINFYPFAAHSTETAHREMSYRLKFYDV